MKDMKKSSEYLTEFGEKAKSLIQEGKGKENG